MNLHTQTNPLPSALPNSLYNFLLSKLLRLLKKNVVVFLLQKSLGVFIRRLRINIYTAAKWIKLVVLAILMSFLFISFDKCGIESVKVYIIIEVILW